MNLVLETLKVYGGAHAVAQYERELAHLTALRRIVKRSLESHQLEKLEDARPYLDESAEQPAPTETRDRSCDCRTCWVQRMPGYMVVCHTCGNKRCPKADNHAFKCTGSNDVGQVGEPETAPHGAPDDCCAKARNGLPCACEVFK